MCFAFESQKSIGRPVVVLFITRRFADVLSFSFVFRYIDIRPHLARVICMLHRQRRREKQQQHPLLNASLAKHTRFTLALYQYIANAQAVFVVFYFLCIHGQKNVNQTHKNILRTHRSKIEIFPFEIQSEGARKPYAECCCKIHTIKTFTPCECGLPKCNRATQTNSIIRAMIQAQFFFGAAVYL